MKEKKPGAEALTPQMKEAMDALTGATQEAFKYREKRMKAKQEYSHFLNDPAPYFREIYKSENESLNPQQINHRLSKKLGDMTDLERDLRKQPDAYPPRNPVIELVPVPDDRYSQIKEPRYRLCKRHRNP